MKAPTGPMGYFNLWRKRHTEMTTQAWSLRRRPIWAYSDRPKGPWAFGPVWGPIFGPQGPIYRPFGPDEEEILGSQGLPHRQGDVPPAADMGRRFWRRGPPRGFPRNLANLRVATRGYYLNWRERPVILNSNCMSYDPCAPVD